MPANVTQASGAGIDAAAIRWRAWFADGTKTDDGKDASFSGSYWQVPECTLRLGILPSFALVEIPLVVGPDETAPALAGVSGGIAEFLTAGTPCYIEAEVGGDAETVLFGRVVDSHHDLKRDRIVVEVLDDRWILSGTPLVGSWWYDEVGAGFVYRQGWPAKLNPEGRANCIFKNVAGYGWVPLFCPPNYGIAPGEAMADPDVMVDRPVEGEADETEGEKESVPEASLKATLWRPDLVCRYVHFALSSTAYATVAGLFPWYPTLPASIEWDKEYYTALTTVARASKSETLNGDNVLRVLNNAIKQAGPYELTMHTVRENQDDGTQTTKNVLGIAVGRYTDEGISLHRPVGAASSVLANRRSVTGGTLRYGAEQLYTRFVTVGDLVYIERRLESDDSLDDNDGTLQYAWSSEEHAEVEAFVAERRNAGVSQADALKQAWRKFTNPCAAYRLNTQYDFADGTSEASFPVATLPRWIKDHLLTSYLENEAGASYADKMRFRREVFVEYKDSSYKLADLGDGFAIDEDGTVWFPGLRENGQSFSIEETGSAPDIEVTITPRQLRLTVAIPCDHALTQAQKLPGDPAPGVDGPTAEQYADTDRVFPGWARVYVAVTPGLYGKELRKDAWPIPEAVAGSTEAADKDGTGTNGTLRDDSAQALAHTIARMDEHGRVERGGSLLFEWQPLTLRPGNQIKQLKGAGGDYPIKAVFHSIRYVNQDGAQLAQAELK